MRKYLIGFLVGVLVATAGVAAADTISLVGKKIQGEAIVTLDGEQIDTAIIVDGKSYAPVRSVAEATGLKAGYEKGNVKLETLTPTKSLSYWEASVKRLNEYLESSQKLVETSQGRVDRGKAYLLEWEEKINNLPDDASETLISDYEKRISDGKQELVKLEAELAERQARVAEIEAEIAEAKEAIAELTKKS